MPGRPVWHVPGSLIAPHYVMTFPEAKEEFGLWVLPCVFRDIVKGLHDFLEEARVACAAVALRTKFTVPARWILSPFLRPERRLFSDGGLVGTSW